AWENAEQVDVTVLRTTQALSVMDLLPDIHRMTKSTIIRRLENEFRDGNTGDG
ncbi:XRE family transcriptional regulator, partial [Escherichia coli]|nr:XRE family transcriptional regulator [Escherichia coli]